MNTALRDYAAQLGEDSIVPAESFKTKVFLGEKLIFKLSEEGKREEKEEYVLKLLAKKLRGRWQPVVPHVVESKKIKPLGMVHVHTRLKGEHPKQITTQLSRDLGEFLAALHGIGTWQKINEFE